MSGCKKVLDYGCGEGWAGITINKSGCGDVTCVDVVENAITLAKFLGLACGVTEGFKAECVSTDWIGSVISMNYYEEPVSKPDKNLEVKNDNEIYLNGVLRMVSRTDEEWTTILSKYFIVEKIEYFAWPGETKETRSIFILRKA